MLQTAAVILASTAVACLACCAPTHRQGEAGGASLPAAEPTHWPFAPVSVRVHPLSRIAVDAAGKRQVELRIECRDLDGDSVRTIGTLWVSLGNEGRAELEHDLGDPAVNQGDWDRVTRTYRRTLPMPEGFECGPGVVLPVKVQLRLSAEVLLSDQGSIACP